MKFERYIGNGELGVDMLLQVLIQLPEQLLAALLPLLIQPVEALLRPLKHSCCECLIALTLQQPLHLLLQLQPIL
ncbi:hypothetical protein D3C75_1267640 [compost metagenome]